MLWRNVNYSYVKARPDLPIPSVKTITTCKRFSRNIQKIQGYVAHNILIHDVAFNIAHHSIKAENQDVFFFQK